MPWHEWLVHDEDVLAAAAQFALGQQSVEGKIRSSDTGDRG